MSQSIIDNAILPKVSKCDSLVIKQAKANNEIFYFSGVPCCRGHICKRYIKGMKCYDCTVLNRLENRDKIKLNQIKRTFNLSKEDYKKLIIKQNSLCAICKNELKFDKNTHIDHCKITNKIRGLLCHWCNVGIGHFKHNALLLRNAALYCEEV